MGEADIGEADMGEADMGEADMGEADMAHGNPRICVIYYSATGNTAAMAHALGTGAGSAGTQVRVRRVRETASPDAIRSNPRWAAWVETTTDPIASLDDLEWADGIALGSPTRFGGPTAQLKSFLDTTGRLWMRGRLVDKVGTAFTTASTAHGGLESTILAINNHFYHWGCLVMPLGYPDEHVRAVTGNPYGASFVSRGGATPDDDCLLSAQTQGKRLARAAAALRNLREDRGVTMTEKP
jgi:NAD(P)H dehydrogenase (quinone)